MCIRDRPSSSTLENLANLHSRAHLDVPELVKRGLLVEDPENGSYHVLSACLERWIFREIQAPPGEEASITAINTWLSPKEGGQSITMAGLLRSFKDKYWSILAGFPEEFSQKLIPNQPNGEEKTGVKTSNLAETVFICYSRNETAFVDKLVSDLNANGVKTWRDVDDIAGARQSNLQGWRAAIEKALGECAAMLIVLSPDAVDSHEVQAEWNHFASYKRPIFPIIANNCEVPFYLKIYQIWDLSVDYPTKVLQLAEILQTAVTESQ